MVRIEKPWAVNHSHPSIVKITKDEKEGLMVQDSETQEYLHVFLSHKNIERFATPHEAIEYFKKTYGSYKEKIVQTFLSNFPSERNNIENLLSQTLPKCTPCVTFGEVERRIKNQEPLSQRDLERYNIMKENENVIKDSLLWVY